jgi:DNA topoisomerase VI subunit A
MALASARREQAEVEKEIDVVDEEIQLLREKLAVRDNEKETLTERHLNLGASMMALESLAGGKSLVRQVAAEGNNGSL